MCTFFKNEKAFTGLEAAIVLIAFVVVAAVFSYVVLGAGFFTTQKSQEVVHTSMQQASSSMEIIGNVYGISTNADGTIHYIKFTVGNTAGGTEMDVPKMVVSYSDTVARAPDVGYISGSKTVVTDGLLGNRTSPNLKWGIIEKINADDDNLLEAGEQFVLGVSTPTSLTVNKQFTVNLQPAVGAVFTVKRTIPAGIDKVNILY